MGLETVVRPVVFPNIRPAPARALLIQDAPDKGLATITGGSNSVIDLAQSYSGSGSMSRMVEVKRVYDRVRVLASNPDGTINENDWIEYEVLRSVEFLENGTTAIGQQYAAVKETDNVQILGRNLVRKNTK